MAQDQNGHSGLNPHTFPPSASLSWGVNTRAPPQIGDSYFSLHREKMTQMKFLPPHCNKKGYLSVRACVCVYTHAPFVHGSQNKLISLCFQNRGLLCDQ